MNAVSCLFPGFYCFFAIDLSRRNNSRIILIYSHIRPESSQRRFESLSQSSRIAVCAMAEMKHEADASEKEENGTKNVFENAMRLNLVFYGEDKTVIYGTSHSSRERERNNRPACLSTQWTENFEEEQLTDARYHSKSLVQFRTYFLHNRHECLLLSVSNYQQRHKTASDWMCLQTSSSAVSDSRLEKFKASCRCSLSCNDRPASDLSTEVSWRRCARTFWIKLKFISRKKSL